jgi:GxxExxY protein
MSNLLHEEVSRDIIGAAMEVLNALKPGLDEKLYENALVIELLERGHTVDQQTQFKVEYMGREIGKLIPDLIVDGCVIADPKVVTDSTTPTWPKWPVTWPSRICVWPCC